MTIFCTAVASPNVDNCPWTESSNFDTITHTINKSIKSIKKFMNSTSQPLTKEYFEEHLEKTLQLRFKEFGEVLMKIFVTKDEFKEGLQGFATKEDLKKFATKDDLKGFATKEDLKKFAIKGDLKIFATKEDLHDGMDTLRDELVIMKDEILTSNDKIAKKLVKKEAEDAAVTHRMDRIEADFGPRITALEAGQQRTS